MLLELAVGDAYGAGFEYADRDFVRAHNTLERFVKHRTHAIVPGRYTDDTQMTLAIAEAIVTGGAWTPEALAERFVIAFKRDPREGYASGFYAFLTSVTSGAEFLARIKPTSDKSGAAMRAAPVGVFPTPEEVCKRAALQAAITHDTPDGIAAAQAAALMTHYFLYRHGPKSDLGRFIERHVPGAWSEPWQGKVKEKGWMSVRAAITAVVASTSMADLLRRCIAFTGDVDTVATIALAAGSCSPEIAQDLPENLVYQLEHGTYGHDYLVALDRQLLALVR
jgi:ADP-ribosylglycohydrolase